MGEVDRQRIAAAKTLEALGYVYLDGEGWKLPRGSAQWLEADALHALLTKRADRLSDSIRGSREAAEFRTIVDALQAYEGKRWPNAKISDGNR